MKKIDLNNDACIGCGSCVGIDPKHFDFNDEGYAIVKNNENLESDKLQDAIDSCPVCAISFVNTSDENTCTCSPCECGCNCEENCSCDDTCECGCNCKENCSCDDTCECGCNCKEK